jgi:transposase
MSKIQIVCSKCGNRFNEHHSKFRGGLSVNCLARAVAELVGNEGGVVSGVINLESSGVEASDWRPRHDEHYHEA